MLTDQIADVTRRLVALCAADDFDTDAILAAQAELAALKVQLAAQDVRATPPSPPPTPAPSPTTSPEQPCPAAVQTEIDRIVEALRPCARDITVEQRGSWLWASGATKPHSALLGKLGLKFHAKKSTETYGVWYWMPPETRGRRRRSNTPEEDIKAKYGNHRLI